MCLIIYIKLELINVLLWIVYIAIYSKMIEEPFDDKKKKNLTLRCKIVFPHIYCII